MFKAGHGGHVLAWCEAGMNREERWLGMEEVKDFKINGDNDE